MQRAVQKASCVFFLSVSAGIIPSTDLAVRWPIALPSLRLTYRIQNTRRCRRPECQGTECCTDVPRRWPGRELSIWAMSMRILSSTAHTLFCTEYAKKRAKAAGCQCRPRRLQTNVISWASTPPLMSVPWPSAKMARGLEAAKPC